MAVRIPSLPFLTQRVVIFSIATLLVLALVITAFQGSLNAHIEAIKGSPSSVYQPNPPPASVAASGFGDLVHELFKPIKLPVTAKSYTDQRGKEFDNGGNKYWQEPMGRGVLIVDIDTRNPDGENDVFSSAKMDWEMVKAEGSGLLTLSHANHFLYSQIHGYDYKYFHARSLKDHWITWIKPRALQEMLRFYKFVVFIDADASIQHLEVPMEFLFNRWNISSQTSIAMPVDTQQVFGGTDNISTDSKGKVVLNSGVVVLQNLPHTFEMMQAWIDCTNEKRYPGCAHWKYEWSHEQRAFSEYIRYDFNPTGYNIVEIPCTEANGFPGQFGQGAIIDDCRGEFIRHYPGSGDHKNLLKTSTSDVIMQSMGELLQKSFKSNRQSMFIEEGWW